MAPPTELDRVISLPTAEGGTRRVAVADRIVELASVGNDARTCAAAVGVALNTLRRWLGVAHAAGVRLAVAYNPNDPRLHDHLDPDGILTPHETRCVKFVDDFLAAQARFASVMSGVVVTAARGGSVVERVTEEYVRGEDGALSLVGRRVQRETLPGDARAAQWWLERRLPETYGRKIEVGVRDAMSDPAEALSPAQREAALVAAIESFSAEAPNL